MAGRKEDYMSTFPSSSQWISLCPVEMERNRCVAIQAGPAITDGYIGSALKSLYLQVHRAGNPQSRDVPEGSSRCEAA